MRPILSLAAWNWRMARRPYAILCAVFAVQQLAVLLYQAQTPDLLGAGLAASYSEGLQIYAFGITFLLAGLLAGPAVNDQKRARCSYTWLTLPLPPAARLAAQALTAAVLLLGVVALQLALYVLYFFPVQVMQNAAATQRIGQEAASMRFYEEVILNRGLYWLIPRRPLRAAAQGLAAGRGASNRRGVRHRVRPAAVVGDGLCPLGLSAPADRRGRRRPGGPAGVQRLVGAAGHPSGRTRLRKGESP